MQCLWDVTVKINGKYRKHKRASSYSNLKQWGDIFLYIEDNYYMPTRGYEFHVQVNISFSYVDTLIQVSGQLIYINTMISFSTLKLS